MTTSGITSTRSADTVDLHLLTDLDEWLAGRDKAVVEWVRSQRFTAAEGAHLYVPALGGEPAVVLVGCAESASLGTLGSLPMALPEGSYAPTKSLDELDALGWALGAYQYTRYKEPKRGPANLVIDDETLYLAVQRTADATALTRDLINAPANDMLPSHLEAASRDLARAFGATISVTTGDALLDSGYNTIHAVGRASADAPRLIDLRWGDSSNPLKITLVGKGVCFDSGGLNIKPSGGMRSMKKDMGGAAQVLGLAQLIMANSLPINLRVMVSAVENAISANAYRPGDIITHLQRANGRDRQHRRRGTARDVRCTGAGLRRAAGTRGGLRHTDGLGSFSRRCRDCRHVLQRRCRRQRGL